MCSKFSTNLSNVNLVVYYYRWMEPDPCHSFDVRTWKNRSFITSGATGKAVLKDISTQMISPISIRSGRSCYLGGPQLDKVFTNLPDGNKFPIVATENKYYDVAVAALDSYFQPMRQDIL